MAWNAAAAEFLGYTEQQAVGARCWQLLAGTDAHGNAHCGPHCPVVELLLRHQPVHAFAVRLRAADGRGTCVRMVALAVSLDSGERGVLHLLHPCRWQEPIIEEVGDGDGRDEGTAGATLGQANAGLSVRELQVFRWLARGMSNARIARALFISPHTVHNHVRRILAKLGAHSRFTAVRRAEELGLLTASPAGASGVLAGHPPRLRHPRDPNRTG